MPRARWLLIALCMLHAAAHAAEPPDWKPPKPPADLQKAGVKLLTPHAYDLVFQGNRQGALLSGIPNPEAAAWRKTEELRWLDYPLNWPQAKKHAVYEQEIKWVEWQRDEANRLLKAKIFDGMRTAPKSD